MKLSIYCIRDSLTGFMSPVIEQNDAVAMRNFAMACDRFPHEQGASLMKWRPQDYSFFCLGEFDSDSGKITPLDVPRFIASGDSVASKLDAVSEVDES